VGGVGRANSSSKAFGISFADRPKAKRGIAQLKRAPTENLLLENEWQLFRVCSVSLEFSKGKGERKKLTGKLLVAARMEMDWSKFCAADALFESWREIPRIRLKMVSP
jgi:hypothetical protein